MSTFRFEDRIVVVDKGEILQIYGEGTARPEVKKLPQRHRDEFRRLLGRPPSGASAGTDNFTTPTKETDEPAPHPTP